MKVKLLISRAAIGAAQNRGDVIDVSADEAKRMIEAGQASPVGGEVEPERAIKRGRPAKDAG